MPAAIIAASDYQQARMERPQRRNGIVKSQNQDQTGPISQCKEEWQACIQPAHADLKA
jgi:hypothetical protein